MSGREGANDALKARRNRTLMNQAEAKGRSAAHRLLQELQRHGLFRGVTVRFGVAA